jgi:hypothetical protein
MAEINIYGYDVDRLHKVLEQLETAGCVPRRVGHTTVLMYMILGIVDVLETPQYIIVISPSMSRAYTLKQTLFAFLRDHNVPVWLTGHDNVIHLQVNQSVHAIRFITMETVQEQVNGIQWTHILTDLNDVPKESFPSNFFQYIQTLLQDMENNMLVNDNQNTTAWWIKTSQGTYGPFGSKTLAESTSLTVPRTTNEVPEIFERTTDGKQILLG